MNLDVKGFAVAAGVVWGLAVFLATLSSIWHGGGQHLQLLSSIYFGYQVTFLGSIIGLIYGLVSGLIAGALLAWLYNLVAARGAATKG